MIAELRCRNFAESTIRSYVRAVEQFSRYFHCPPHRLGPAHVRQYQAMLFTHRKLASSTVTQHLAALRFLYVKVLKRGWSIAETPYPKKVQRLPLVLSPEDVAKLIDAADSPFHRILLMTLYATGARRAEVAHLKVSDIDSRRMVVHIRGGKGRKDRDIMLSPKRPRVLSRPRFFGQLAIALHSVPVWNTNTSILIRFDTASRLICWKQAPTSVRFRCCSVIVTWKKRRSICTFRTGTSAQPPVHWMR
jgi:integrase